MFGRIMLALIIVPVVELYVVLKVGGILGFLPTVALLLLISFVGAWLVRREGSGAWRRIQETLVAGNMPSNEIADGALIIFGGTLLLTPGFFTDALGLSMLIPFLRAPVRNYLVKRTSVTARTATSTYVSGRFGQAAGGGFTVGGFGSDIPGRGHPGARGPIVDVEEVDLHRTDGPDVAPPEIER